MTQKEKNMDDNNKSTQPAGSSGRSYSIEEILREYGHEPVKPGAFVPGEEPKPAKTAAIVEDEADLVGIEVEFDEFEEQLEIISAPSAPARVPEAAPLDEPEPVTDPAISLSDFDEAYRQQRKESKQHRRLVLKERVRNKRFRYIKQVKKIAGEIGDERRQRELEEQEKVQSRSIEQYIADYTGLSRSLALRQWAIFIMSLLVVYMSVASQIGLPMPETLVYRNHPYLFLALNIILMGGIMLCGLDVFTSGVRSLLKLKPDMDSLVAIANFLCFLYCVSVVLFPRWGGYISYSGVAALSMFFAVLGRRRVYAAKARVLRSAAKIKEPAALIRREKAYGEDDCIAKVPARNIAGFVRGLEERGRSSQLERLYASAAVAFLIVLSFVCLFRGEGTRLFFYVSSAAAMLPACGLVAGGALPYGRLSKRLMKEGVAIGGGEGIRRLGATGRVVLTDADLFGPQAITLQGYKLFNDFKRDRAITYTASILSSAGCGIARQFKELAIKEFCTLVNPSEMEFSDYGGIKAVIEGDHVMVGTAPYMYRMGMRPPADIKLRTAVFCAVNMEIVGVFALRYLPNEVNRQWIGLLSATGRSPILASRDFNVTPALLEQRFRIKSGQLEYPEIDNRLELNSTLETSDGSFGLLVLRDTLEGYVGGVEGTRRLQRVSGINALLGVIASAFGALSVAMLLLGGSYVAVSPLNTILYSLLWALPVFLFSGWVTRF